MALISVVFNSKSAYCDHSLPLKSPTPQGKASYIKIAPRCEAQQLEHFFVVVLHKGISASYTSVNVVSCCTGSFYPVPSSPSGVIVPLIVVNLCPWNEVSSKSSDTTIFPVISRISYIFLIICTVYYLL